VGVAALALAVFAGVAVTAAGCTGAPTGIDLTASDATMTPAPSTTAPADAVQVAAPAADPATGELAGDCTLIVPRNPLSAQGLATPYQLAGAAGGACHEANLVQAAFVQATIVDPATGRLSVYNPLVIDAGTKPAVAPAVPALPNGAVVGVWFGFNGNSLMLAKTGGRVSVQRNHRHLSLRDSNGSLGQGRCVNGLPGSVFGQYAYCNAAAFFQAAHAAQRAGRLSIPAPGRAADGMPCPTTRDFSVVDQDQSDNVTATYIVLPDGRTAQPTKANIAALQAQGGKLLTNASDNGLLVNFVDKALGCTPFMAPDLANGGAPTTSLALDELQASRQAAPVALIPPNNPMTLVNDQPSRDKTNLYRVGVDMPAVGNDLRRESTSYCTNMTTIGSRRIQRNQARLRNFQTPDAAAADSLYTFLGLRLAVSYDNLTCARLTRKPNPITVRTDGDIAVDVAFDGRGLPTAAPTTAAPTTLAPLAPTATDPTTTDPTTTAPTTAVPPSAAAPDAAATTGQGAGAPAPGPTPTSSAPTSNPRTTTPGTPPPRR